MNQTITERAAVAQAPSSFFAGKFCIGKRVTVGDGYSSVDGVGTLAAYRWESFCAPGKWHVSGGEIGFYFECDAVVNDFGTVVRVPS